MVSFNCVPDVMFYSFFFFFYVPEAYRNVAQSWLLTNQTKSKQFNFHIESTQDVETSGCFRITENRNTLPMAEFGLNTQNFN